MDEAGERPKYYRRDGTPIFDVLEWAELFEDWQGRSIGHTWTLYGERLSTVWLGLDHEFSFIPNAPPLIFETMLFAPGRLRDMRWLRKLLYPNDEFQLRYSTEEQARAGHERTRKQCLIPPPLRKLILYRVLGDDAWS
jgi:hypothetical protein